ncbi:MAG: carboxypeptidase-like regulatory domain-containing protein, partial [Owenweeksia sp.]
MKLNTLIFLILSCSISAYSQSYEIKGKVVDKVTGEPLPFVNIIADQSYNGTSTDIDGRFTLTSA